MGGRRTAGSGVGGRRSVPELPEVETIVRELAPRLEGAKIARVRLAKTDVLRRVSKPPLLRTLRGNAFEQVSRRAKHAVFRLEGIAPQGAGQARLRDRKSTRLNSRHTLISYSVFFLKKKT